MAEYIEREAVYEMLENAQLISDGEYCGYCTEDVTISAIPAADVAPVVHGHCEEVEPAYVKLDGQCCRCGIPMGLKDNYCPNCGVRMDGE